MLAPSRPTNATVMTSINKCLCQHTVNESTIQSTRAGLGRCHLAFAVANYLLNWRFATATVGSCSDCWKLQWVAGKARTQYDRKCAFYFNCSFFRTKQLQHTKISDRKLFIFQHGPELGCKQRDKWT